MNARAWRTVVFGVLVVVSGEREAHATPTPTPSIASITDTGNAMGQRQFHISGSFPPAVPGCTGYGNKYPDVECYRVTVFCQGAALEPGLISSKTLTSIDVSIPERPSGATSGTGSRCVFTVQVLDSGTPGSKQATFDYGFLVPPPIEIHGVADRGRVGTQHYFELYGYFPVGASFSANVACDGQSILAGISTPNNPSTVLNQINIWFNETEASSKSCVFSVYRLNDSVGTPLWYQRVNGAKLGGLALPSYWGAYYWGGFEPEWANRTNVPQIAVRRLHDAGITGPIRFALSPGQRNAFPTEFSDWYDDYTESGFHIESGAGERCAGFDGVPGSFLPTAVCTTRFLNALAEIPAQSTIVLTTLDEASSGPYGGNGHFIDLSWMSIGDNQNAVKAEYQNLAAALFRTQAGTGKTFVISNWEADSMIYSSCGGSAAVADAMRACPNGIAPGNCIPASCSNYLDRIRALRLWFQARKDGVDAARVAAGNPTGLVIADAIEFSQYRIVDGQGVIQGCPTPDEGLGLKGCLKNADALHGIIPYVHPKFALYSAWESTGLGHIDQDLRELALYLYSTNPSDPPRFGLGEFGQPGQSSVPFSEWLFREDVSAARRAMTFTRASGAGSPLEFAVLWQAFPTVDAEEGLLTVEGNETDAMRMLVAGATNYGPGSVGTTVIYGVRETPDYSSPTCSVLSGTRTEPYRYFELYGNYPAGAASAVWSRCSSGTPNDWWSAATIVGTPSTGQIDIAIPEVAGNPDLWCVFSVTGGGQTSPSFGPVRSPGAGPCNPVAP